ncbi:flagellar MS-ring protein [Stieleria neptunia]|uniref:Flagellar MS-ring protein n=1 Tax=Stieleria neptunia TaxID=2527979 RepID=A0A518HWH1_9BACT|nr:flagellar MS-ring protein [Stieleria neptunia]
MLRQRTERFKSHLDTVPPLSGASALSRAVACVIAGLLILGGIYYVTPAGSTESMEPLFGGKVLREMELSQLEFAFSRAGLSDWRREDGRMLIPRETRHEYLAALEQASALPYALQSSVEEALVEAPYFESESARRTRHQYAKARDLGKKIAAFDDILWASVDYDEQSAGGFDERRIRSASVLLVSDSGKPIAPGRISMIQNLVAGAYAGMDADQVTVTDTSARKTYNGSDDPLTRQQRQAEYELEQRLTELLGGYRGLHIAARSVYRESGDGKPIALSKSIQKESTPGEFLIRVSVGVPESQFHAQWVNDHRSQHPESALPLAPTQEQLDGVRVKVMDNIRDAVKPLVATAADTDEQTVRVWSFPDPDKTPKYPSPVDRVGQWAGVVGPFQANPVLAISLGCLLLVASVFALAAMRLRLRNPAMTTSSVAEMPTPEPAPRQTDRSAKTMSNAADTTMRDDLAELVESNPELAAQIVHSWIADAA